MATKSFDFDKLKKQSARFSKKWQKKLHHLSESVSRSGLDGANHWLKSHDQIDELQEALADLCKAAEEKNFRLTQVETTFSSFAIPKEDSGQAEWYKIADQLLSDFEKSLLEKKKLDNRKLQLAINELKYISQADEFHQRYHIESIQEKVTAVYNSLLNSINEFKSLEKNKAKKQNEHEKLELAKLEAEKAKSQAKKSMMEGLKIKEKRLAIIEEKKRRIAEKELFESQSKVETEQSELQAKKAESERQAKLQDAYVDLQIEEKISHWSLKDTVKILQRKLDQNSIDSDIKDKFELLLDEIQPAE